jgi:hypothetical protein
MAYIGQNPIDAFRGLASYDTFTGDGSTTTFDLTKVAPDGGQNDILVVVNNVIQEPGVSKSYTLGVDGNGEYKRVTFNTAPESADEIYIINPGRTTALNTVSDNAITAAKLNVSAITGQVELAAAPADDDALLIYDTSATSLKKIQSSNLVGSSLITGKTELSAIPADDDLFLVFDTSASSLKKLQKSFLNPTLTYASGTATGDGSTVAFSINSGRTVEDVVIIVNGFSLTPTTDYTISGTTLTFITAPAASAEISIRYLAVPGTYSHADYTGDASTTAFTINSGRSVDDVIVIVNGLTLVPTTDYTIASTTLTFVLAPAASAEITVRYLRLT